VNYICALFVEKLPVYTMSQKKAVHWIFHHNFVKFELIYKFLTKRFPRKRAVCYIKV